MPRLARSVIESLVDETVLTGLDSPVVILDDGDMGASDESMGRLGEGGEDRFDGGGVSSPVPSSSNSALRSPVDRLNPNDLDRSGDDSPLEPDLVVGDWEPGAIGVESPSVDVLGVVSSSPKLSMT